MTVRPRRFGHCQISSDGTLFELPLAVTVTVTEVSIAYNQM